MLATGSLMRMYKNRAVMAWRQGFSYIKWIKNIKFCNILAKKLKYQNLGPNWIEKKENF